MGGNRVEAGMVGRIVREMEKSAGCGPVDGGDGGGV